MARRPPSGRVSTAFPYEAFSVRHRTDRHRVSKYCRFCGSGLRCISFYATTGRSQLRFRVELEMTLALRSVDHGKICAGLDLGCAGHRAGNNLSAVQLGGTGDSLASRLPPAPPPWAEVLELAFRRFQKPPFRWPYSGQATVRSWPIVRTQHLTRKQPHVPS